MATANRNRSSANVRPDNTIEFDENVVQKLVDSDSKFANLSSEAKASCETAIIHLSATPTYM
jgi:hypothetical protein